MTWNAPLNVLIPEIFQYITYNSHLLQCALVCKLWKIYAIPQLYSTVSITSFHLKEDRIKYIQDYSHGKFIKHLKVNIYKDTSWWHSILSISPNLTSIEHLNYEDEHFWELLASFSHSLTKLEEIHSFRCNRLYNGYYKCLLQYKETLRHFEIFDFDLKNIQTRSFFTQLCEFKNLRVLECYSLNDVPINVLNTLVDSCPRINTISIKIHNARKLTGYIPPHSIIPNRSLRVLRLHSHTSFTISEYLFYKFTSLEFLELDFQYKFKHEKEMYNLLKTLSPMVNLPDLKINVKMDFLILPSIYDKDFKFRDNLNLKISYARYSMIPHNYLMGQAVIFLSRERTNRYSDSNYFAGTDLVWSQISQYLRTLTLANFPNEDINGDHFNGLFRHCTVINTLKIVCGNQLHLDAPPEPYPALKNLTLNAPKIHYDTYVRCAERFVNLKSLSVYTYFKHVFSLNIPAIKLDTLYLQLSTKSENTSINISTVIGKSYSMGCGEPFIDIYCYSIESFVLIVNDVPLDIILK